MYGVPSQAPADYYYHKSAGGKQSMGMPVGVASMGVPVDPNRQRAAAQGLMYARGPEMAMQHPAQAQMYYAPNGAMYANAYGMVRQPDMMSMQHPMMGYPMADRGDYMGQADHMDKDGGQFRKRERSVWTQEEDNVLSKLVSIYGSTRWTLIARELKRLIPSTKKDNAQCSQHWRRVLCPKIRKIGDDKNPSSPSGAGSGSNSGGDSPGGHSNNEDSMDSEPTGARSGGGGGGGAYTDDQPRKQRSPQAQPFENGHRGSPTAQGHSSPYGQMQMTRQAAGEGYASQSQGMQATAAAAAAAQSAAAYSQGQSMDVSPASAAGFHSLLEFNTASQLVNLCYQTPIPPCSDVWDLKVKGAAAAE